MKKMVLYAVCVFAIAIITMSVLAAYSHDEKRNIDFLKEYGWSVDENIVEAEELVIPKIFDEVYRSYNKLQAEAGLDLEPYKGKRAVRYTYIVLNYPERLGQEVRANVICVGGKPIAGDVMTVKLDGFMRSLVYPKNDND